MEVVKQLLSFQSRIDISSIDSYFNHIEYNIELRIESLKMQLDHAVELFEEKIEYAFEQACDPKRRSKFRYGFRGIPISKPYKSVYFVINSGLSHLRMNLFKISFPVSKTGFMQLEQRIFKRRRENGTSVFQYASSKRHYETQDVPYVSIDFQFSEDHFKLNYDFYLMTVRNAIFGYFDFERELQTESVFLNPSCEFITNYLSSRPN